MTSDTMPDSDCLTSVVVTFFNQRAFVTAALDSVLAQDREDIEIIAVDDGSTDGTQDVLRTYEDRAKLILHAENKGLSEARNTGVVAATKDYVMFLDGDDLLLPWAVSTYEQLILTRRPVMVFGSIIWFEGDIPLINNTPESTTFFEYDDYFKKDRSLGAWGGAMVVHRPSCQAVGGFDRSLAAAEDYDLAWKLGVSGSVLFVIDPATVLHRAHADQNTRQVARMLDAVAQLADRERRGSYPGGRRRSRERRACVGGCVFHWTLLLRRAAYRHALVVLVRNWRFVATAFGVRVGARLKGRRPAKTTRLSGGGVP